MTAPEAVSRCTPHPMTRCHDRVIRFPPSSNKMYSRDASLSLTQSASPVKIKVLDRISQMRYEAFIRYRGGRIFDVRREHYATTAVLERR
jgi:hypothetical protein